MRSHVADACSFLFGVAVAWLVVFTKPNAEPQAAGSFSRNQWSFYYPRTRVREIYRPFFPRYLFLEEGDFDPISARYQPGVSDILRSGGTNSSFSRIADTLVRELRLREQDGAIPLPPPAEKAQRILEPGQQIRFSHAGKNLIGQFVSRPAPERVLMLLSILGAKQFVNIGEDAIR